MNNEDKKTRNITKTLIKSDLERIESFYKLDYDWDGQGARPPSRKAIDNAKAYVMKRGITNFDIDVDASGGIILTINDEDYLFKNNGRNFKYEQVGGVMTVNSFSI